MLTQSESSWIIEGRPHLAVDVIFLLCSVCRGAYLQPSCRTEELPLAAENTGDSQSSAESSLGNALGQGASSKLKAKPPPQGLITSHPDQCGVMKIGSLASKGTTQKAVLFLWDWTRPWDWVISKSSLFSALFLPLLKCVDLSASSHNFRFNVGWGAAHHGGHSRGMPGLVRRQRERAGLWARERFPWPFQGKERVRRGKHP